MQQVAHLIHLSYAKKLGLSGKGITIAYLDTGINRHLDFQYPSSRILSFVDFLSQKKYPYDDNGHGTHVAGIAASYTRGIAPASNLVVCKVLDRQGNGSFSHLISCFEWLLKNKERYHIRIVNLSIGMDLSSNFKKTALLLQWVERLWDLGLVVCTSSGNSGPSPSSVTVPGTSKKIITVGSCEGLSSSYSGRGPTAQCIVKPDVLAPGTNIRSCYRFSQYAKRSGTSMATPVLSGAIALYLEKNPTSSNKSIKLKLRSSCDDLGYPPNVQGWGRINLKKFLS